MANWHLSYPFPLSTTFNGTVGFCNFVNITAIGTAGGQIDVLCDPRQSQVVQHTLTNIGDNYQCYDGKPLHIAFSGWSSTTNAFMDGFLGTTTENCVTAPPTPSPSLSPTEIPTMNPTLTPTSVPTSITPTPTTRLCLNFRTLRLDRVGDVDGTTEELEFGIQSSYQSKTCGLYILNKDIADSRLQTLAISTPCVENENVHLFFNERDICYDDYIGTEIRCSLTPVIPVPQKFIEIVPNSHVFSKTDCDTLTADTSVCLSIEGGAEFTRVGAQSCTAVSLGQEECGTTEASEGNSQYMLEYTITSNCEFGSGNTAVCSSERNYTSGTCDAVEARIAALTNADPTTTTATNESSVGEISYMLAATTITLLAIANIMDFI